MQMVRQAAEREHRSTNAEAAIRLRRSFEPVAETVMPASVRDVENKRTKFARNELAGDAPKVRVGKRNRRAAEASYERDAADGVNMTEYEGGHSLSVLLGRTEPEDFGPRVELWRALRNVSRPWLAYQTGVPVKTLLDWESARVLIPEVEQQPVTDLLDEMDARYPHLAERAVRNMQAHEQANADRAQRIAKLRAVGGSEDQIDWLPGSSTYADIR